APDSTGRAARCRPLAFLCRAQVWSEVAGPVAADSDLGLRTDDLEAIQSGLDAAIEVWKLGPAHGELGGPLIQRLVGAQWSDRVEVGGDRVGSRSLVCLDARIGAQQEPVPVAVSLEIGREREQHDSVGSAAGAAHG